MQNLDEKIHIEQYNPEWPKYFDMEKPLLMQILRSNVIDIEHHGSTSVPSLIAKPIIDMLVGVTSIDIGDAARRMLVDAGYEDFGEIRPGRLYFRKRGQPSYNLAIVEWHGELWKNYIYFREYLRSNSDEVDAYSKMKTDIIASGTDNLLEYHKSKEEFVVNLVDRAVKWGGDNA